jgi:hypothetical protein
MGFFFCHFDEILDINDDIWMSACSFNALSESLNAIFFTFMHAKVSDT